MKQKHKVVLYVVALAMLTTILLLIGFRTSLLKLIYPKEYEELIEEYSSIYEVEENLIYSIIKTESNFNKNAKSNKDALGLMQIIESTAKEVALKNDIQIDYTNITEELKNADINIQIGVIYICELIEMYECLELAVAAYNAGIGTVNNWIEKGIIKSDGSDIENIPYKETNNYVRKIIVRI